MSSERKKRRDALAIIEGRLPRLRVEAQGKVAELEAFEAAVAALSEEPRRLTECSVLVELVPISSFQTFRAHCGECENVLDGFNDNWSYCPKCGSRITEVKHEETAQEASDRLTDRAIRENFA